MKKENKKAQISQFILIGIIILIAFSFYIYTSRSLEKARIIPLTELESGVSSIKFYTTSCITKILIEAEILYGARNTNSIANYINNNLKSCTDFDIFTEQGFNIQAGDVISEIVLTTDNRTLIVTVDFPIKVRKQDRESRFNKFYTAFILETESPLESDQSGSVTNAFSLTSSNRRTRITIPIGTKVTDRFGNPITEIEIVERDVSDYVPGPIIERVIYDLIPDGAQFDPPTTLVIKYNDVNQDGIVDGTNVNENDVKIAWWDQPNVEWKYYPSTVDTINNRITATVSHFTAAGAAATDNAEVAVNLASGQNSRYGLKEIYIADVSSMSHLQFDQSDLMGWGKPQIGAMAAGDFDSDGYEEVTISYTSGSDSSEGKGGVAQHHQDGFSIYGFKNLDEATSITKNIKNFAAGNFKAKGYDQLAITYDDDDDLLLHDLKDTTPESISFSGGNKHEIDEGKKINPRAFVAGDFNNDNKAEIAYSFENEKEVKVISTTDLQSETAKTSNCSFNLLSDGWDCEYIKGAAVGDLDGDEKLELIILIHKHKKLGGSNCSDTKNFEKNYIYIIDAGSITPCSTTGTDYFDSSSYIYEIATGDFNRDGKMSVVVFSGTNLKFFDVSEVTPKTDTEGVWDAENERTIFRMAAGNLNKTTVTSTTQTCSDQGGTKCSPRKNICSAELFTASDTDYCCIGICTPRSELTCSEQGGAICDTGEQCKDGSFVDSSDAGTDDSAMCCIEGTCAVPPSLSISDMSESEDTEFDFDLHDYTSYEGDKDELSYEVTEQTNTDIVSCAIEEEHTLKCTPVENAVGYSHITVKVSIGSLWNEDDFNLTYTAVNDAPNMTNLPDKSIYENSGLNKHIIDLSIYTIDPDEEDTITYTITEQTNTTVANCVISDDHYIDCSTATQYLSGYSYITVQVSDGQLSSSDEFKLTVDAVNDPPYVNVQNHTIDEDTAPEENWIDLHIAIADPESAPEDLTYEFISQSNSNLINCYLTDSRYINCNKPAQDQFGYNDVTIKAADPEGNSAELMIKMIVSPVNDAPVLNIPDQSINEDSGKNPDVVNLLNYISDPESAPDELTFEITHQSDTSIANCNISDEYYIDCTPLANKSGTSEITVKATDPGDASSEGTFILTVNNTNDPPIVDLTALSPINIPSGGPSGIFDLDEYVEDIDNEDSELNWYYSGNICINVIINSEHEVTLQHQELLGCPSTETITFRAKDPYGDSDSDSITVNIT